MRILITNDDGINAPGLKVLEAIAHEIAGPEGEVWTVAPAFEQSVPGGHALQPALLLSMTASDHRPAEHACHTMPADVAPSASQ